MLSFFKWIVYSNIWISLSVVSLIFYSVQIGIYKLSIPYALISFFATLFAYNFQRIEKSKNSNKFLSERHIWINKNVKTIKAITIISFLSTVGIAFTFFSFKFILSAIPLSLLVLFYAGNRWLKVSLRNISYLKIILISLVWAFVVVVFPSIMNLTSVETKNVIFAILIFLYITSLCIPFDIRDLETDQGFVKTIPFYLGGRNSKLLAVFFLFVVTFFAWMNNWIAFSIVSIISTIVIFFVNEKRKELFYTGLIDGLFLLFPITHYFIIIIT